MPHTPLRVLNIAVVAGYDVNMDMENALPGRRPYVNSDIVSIRLELLVQPLAFLGNQFYAGVDLFRGQVEKTSDMTTRDYQSMPRAHRVGITSTVGEFTL